MKNLLAFLLVAILCLEFVSARILYYADEVDYRNNVAYALHNPYDNADPDIAGDFDRYACISLDDYNKFANADNYDSYKSLTARTASRNDLKRLRREDQLKIINEDPYDGLDEADIGDYEDWNCYTLVYYNSRASRNAYDKWRVVDFTHFDDIYEVQKIGKYRYNNFYTLPEDIARFDLQYTRAPKPYYEPYAAMRTQYPLYGYGIRRIEDY
ncbi:MAG: hypothetical protein QXT19_00765 [Candidatus Woesearchaeota archaeon]